MDTVSVIITAREEPQTVGRALKAILDQDSDVIKEIILVAPDKETQKAARESTKDRKKLIFLQDSGQGKPAAINLAFQKATGEILVLTDGDVHLQPLALNHLLGPFKDPQVGGACGRPVPTNPKNTLLGFWAYFLTDSAHQIRQQLSEKNQFMELSGYLLAIRKKIVGPIPAETLADDSYLSHLLKKAGYNTAYAPEAKVMVKFPANLSDWFKQKKRSAFEYWQKDYSSGQTMRSPFKEAVWGIKLACCYPENPKEIFWLILLFGARIILWLQILVLKLSLVPKRKLWVKVDSTKQ